MYDVSESCSILYLCIAEEFTNSQICKKIDSIDRLMEIEGNRIAPDEVDGRNDGCTPNYTGGP